MRKYLYLFLGILFFSSCQTEIDIDVPSYGSKLVIEGMIENDKPAVVILTKSIPYFSDININFEYFIENVLVTDAKVTVTSASGESEELQLGLSEESAFGVAYVGRDLLGRSNERYTLTIEYDDKIYTANTSIVNTFDLDSIWFYPIGKPEDSLRMIRMILNDNPATKDYYQFRVKVRNEKWQDPVWAFTLPPVFDDATFNGLKFNYEVLRTTPSSLFATLLNDEERKDYFRIYFRPGDIVYVKRSLLDYESYRFWSTATSEVSFGQNAFISPPPIEGNITCNTGEKVLGAWCGYASKIDTLIYNK